MLWVLKRAVSMRHFFEHRKHMLKLIDKKTVLDLGLISIASLGPRALTKVESHVNFTESQKVSQPIFFCNVKLKEVS